MGKVVHFEIPVDDAGQTAKFYGEVFGWHIIPAPEMQYTVVHTGPTDDKTSMVKESGFINGGLFKGNGRRTNPVIIIDVDSVDESAKKIEASGGKVIENKMQVGEMGYVAYFTDPQGNVLGIWENIRKA
jgi:predicted enzyme related to lactoylglutathione lyase